MFDLSKSMDQWKEQLKREEGFSRDNIEELEEHLREEMGRLAQAGLDGEEAFLLAARRLGRVDSLKEEFAKVNSSLVWLNRLRWMAAGVLLFLSASTADAALRKALPIAAAATSLSTWLIGILSPLLSLGILTLLVFCAVRTIARRSRGYRGTFPRTLAGRFAVLLGVFLWFTLLPLAATATELVSFRHIPAATMGRVLGAMLTGDAILSVALPLIITAWMLKTPRRHCS